MYSFSSLIAKQSSLVFLAICFGIPCTTFTRFYDQRIFGNRRKHHQVLQPEDEFTGLLLGALCSLRACGSLPRRFRRWFNACIGPFPYSP